MCRNEVASSRRTVADLSRPRGNRGEGGGAASDAAFDWATVISLPGAVGASDIEFHLATHRGPRGTIVRRADRLSNGGRPLGTDFSHPPFPSRRPTRKRQRLTGALAPPFASGALPQSGRSTPAFKWCGLRRHQLRASCLSSEGAAVCLPLAQASGQESAKPRL